MKVQGMLRMDFRQCRWLYGILLAYLGYLMLSVSPYHTFSIPSEDAPMAYTQALIFVQLVPCVYLCVLAAVQFEETFRTPAQEYLHTLYIPKSVLLVLRPLVTLLPLAILYLPVSLHAAKAMTASAAENSQFLPPGMAPPTFTWDFIYLQSLPMLACCYLATVALECIIRSKAVTLILALTWFGLDIGGLSGFFGKLSLFRCALENFSPMPGAQPNTYMALVYAAVFFAFPLIFYRRKKAR